MNVQTSPSETGSMANARGRRTILIVGGGLSGSLLALRAVEDPDNTVALIERSAAAGRGVAYGACDPDHRLNVPLFRMEVGLTPSFAAWLRENRPEELEGEADPAEVFATRRSFGDYVEAVTEGAVAAGRLIRVRGAVVEIGRDETPYVRLLDGRTLRGSHVVLATGNNAPRTPRLDDPDGVLESPVFTPDPWSAERDRPVDPDAAVLLIGSGLTMVDVALRLARRGHRGPMTALSRRGLAPNRHVAGGQWRNAFAESARPPLEALRLLRREARAAAEAGVPWQRVIDAVRPSLAGVWISWDREDRRRFLRHCRTIWDIHRHRMAQTVARDVDALLEAGRLTIRAGRIAGLRRSGGGASVTIRPRGGGAAVTLEVGSIVNCTGPRSSFDDLNEPAFIKLKEQGLIVPDDHGLGVRTLGCAALDRYSTPSDWLFAIGPLTRPEWWEITAVPEISAQSTFLANDLGRAGQSSLLRDFVDLGAGI